MHRTSDRTGLEFSPDQLLNCSLQGGVVLTRPAPCTSRVDGVIRASDGGAGGAPVHELRVQRVDDVDAGGGRPAAGPGVCGPGDGLQGLDPVLQALHLLTCRTKTDRQLPEDDRHVSGMKISRPTQKDESEEEAEEEQQGEQERQEPLPPAAAGAEPKTRLVLTDL